MGKKRKRWTHGEYVRVLHYLWWDFKRVLATFRSKWLVPPEVDDDPILNPYKAAVPGLFESVLLPEEIASLEAVPFFTVEPMRFEAVRGGGLPFKGVRYLQGPARGVVQLYATMFDKKGEEFCYWHLWKAVANPLVGPPPARGRYVQPEIRDECDRDRVDRLHRIVVGWLAERKARAGEKRAEVDALRRIFPAFPLPDKSAGLPDLGEVIEQGRDMGKAEGQDFWYDPKSQAEKPPWERKESRDHSRDMPGRMIEVLRRWLRYKCSGVYDVTALVAVKMGEDSTSQSYERIRKWKQRVVEDLKALAPVVRPIKAEDSPFKPAT